MVWHENGGCIVLPAKDEEHAKIVFVKCLENILGRKDRGDFVKITHVIPYRTDDPYCTHDNLKKLERSEVCKDCGEYL